VEQLFHNLVADMQHVPSPLIYLISAVWLGLESAGIGVPIEPMMLFVGSLAAQSIVNPVLATATAALGSLAFASLAYVIGKRVGTATIGRVGRFIGLNQQRAEHVELWLRHRGALGVVVARETPIVRTFGSYVMGAAEVPMPTFVWGTLVGAFIYCGIFIGLGTILGQHYEAPLHALDQIGLGGVLIVVGIIAAAIVLHHFWGRLTLRRIAWHFRRHQARLAAVATT
jgi:membrane protein DedA with SNARE-associated domain